MPPKWQSGYMSILLSIVIYGENIEHIWIKIRPKIWDGNRQKLRLLKSIYNLQFRNSVYILQLRLKFCNSVNNFALPFTISQLHLQFCSSVYNFAIPFTILQFRLQFHNSVSPIQNGSTSRWRASRSSGASSGSSS
jgi:hypothetical protein